MPKYTNEELQTITDVVRERCAEHVREMDGKVLAAGMVWYDDAHAQARRIAGKTGSSVDKAAAVIAALSPRVKWTHNVKDTDALMHGALTGFNALGNNIVKAWRIMEGEDIETVLGGRKVRSFYRNIAHPTTSHDATLDIWMLRALIPDAWTDHYAERYAFFARKGVYDAVSEGIRQAADERGLLAHQLQAAIWIHVRGKGE